MYFRDVKPDVTILEVGIGGLLDSTNVITPLLSIISNVSYDHMSILGDTLEQIAENKLGIVKPNVPLVTINNPLINELIINTCEKLNSKLILVNQDDIKNINISIGESKFDYKQYKNIILKMSGKHQTENASLVIEAINLLKENFLISDENIYQGLSKTFWPGRLEVIQNNPYIILDGAHNIDGITRLHDFIKTIRNDFNKIVLVLAISSNKETEKMINEIECDVDEIIFTSFTYKRSEDYNILYEYSKHPKKRKCEDIGELINLSKSNKDENIVWIFSGSLYFVSELRKRF
jgi:dihydrofolate synthase/folylpolyglutamate synthase